jgi:hypothetical protein
MRFSLIFIPFAIQENHAGKEAAIVDFWQSRAKGIELRSGINL